MGARFGHAGRIGAEALGEDVGDLFDPGELDRAAETLTGSLGHRHCGEMRARDVTNIGPREANLRGPRQLFGQELADEVKTTRRTPASTAAFKTRSVPSTAGMTRSAHGMLP